MFSGNLKKYLHVAGTFFEPFFDLRTLIDRCTEKADVQNARRRL